MDYQSALQLVQGIGLRGAEEISIDLSVVAEDKEYSIAGNYFYIKDTPDQISFIKVRTNSVNEPAISYTKQTGFLHPFNKLYITTPTGQAGEMKILIAAEAPQLFEIIDNRSYISQTMDYVLQQLRGDILPETWGTEKTVGNGAAVKILASNSDRVSCIIQAKSTNTGIVYIGFDNTVTTTKWIAELQAGQAFAVDNYRGDLYARASAADQLVGYGEW